MNEEEHAPIQNHTLPKNVAIGMGNSAMFPISNKKHLAVAGAATNAQLSLSRKLGNKEKGLAGDLPMDYDVVLIGKNNRHLNPRFKSAKTPLRVHIIDNIKDSRGSLYGGGARIWDAIEELYEKYGDVMYTINQYDGVYEIKHDKGKYLYSILTGIKKLPTLDGKKGDPHAYKITDEDEKKRIRLIRERENRDDPQRLIDRGLIPPTRSGWTSPRQDPKAF